MQVSWLSVAEPGGGLLRSLSLSFLLGNTGVIKMTALIWREEKMRPWLEESAVDFLPTALQAGGASSSSFEAGRHMNIS